MIKEPVTASYNIRNQKIVLVVVLKLSLSDNAHFISIFS